LLDRFMGEMKTYMKDNDLEDDEFMRNLCDDIFVCTKSLYSTRGEMYLASRAVSQGKERAYNLRNLHDLEANTVQHPDMTVHRSLSDHAMSQNRTTAYASQGAAGLMRAVSEGTKI